ncbi:hypothetical protein ABFS83_08G044200 [Erythranthe nasuta]
MVTLTVGPSQNLNISEEKLQPENGKALDYELCREQRIKENRVRMEKLGILNLSVELNSLKPTPSRSSHRKTPPCRHSPLPTPGGPVRRSSRLQNSTPVTYCELNVPNNEKSWNDVREVGSKPEVYTDEHEKLLGNTEMDWTLFVDGYGKDGKRIYDPVKGKTCHQCRQKTLGHRTHCIKCNLVQGQFCGDCLYMRYGEHVLEANQNPNWICPACRGICNCSLCRQAKGWPPTGTLYRKISSLGYKSVAHYLIQTRRSNTDSDENVGNKVPISAKRSLPFSDIDEHSKNALLSELDQEFGDGKIAAETTMEPLNHDKDSIPETVERGNESEIKKEKNFIPENGDLIAPEAATPKSMKKKRVLSEPTTDSDSIARRLRQRRNKTDNTEETRNEEDASKIADVDSIASRLRTRRRVL